MEKEFLRRKKKLFFFFHRGQRDAETCFVQLSLVMVILKGKKFDRIEESKRVLLVDRLAKFLAPRENRNSLQHGSKGE